MPSGGPRAAKGAPGRRILWTNGQERAVAARQPGERRLDLIELSMWFAILAKPLAGFVSSLQGKVAPKTGIFVIDALIIGHFKQETLNHSIMLSIERDECKRPVDCGGRDKRIENVKPVCFCVGLQESVGSRPNAVAERDDRVQRQESIDRRQVPLVSGADEEFHGRDLRQRPRLS